MIEALVQQLPHKERANGALIERLPPMREHRGLIPFKDYDFLAR
jgi:hypothetical protein